MLIFVNENGEIKDVGTTTDLTLTPQEVTDGSFDGMSVALICCYRVTIDNGNVVMRTPYIDSRLLDHIDQLGKQVQAVTPYTLTKTAYIDDTECVFTGVPNGNMTVYCKVLHTTEIDGDRVAVKFEPLEEVTDITISII